MRVNPLPAQRRLVELLLRKEVVAVPHPAVQNLVVAAAYGCPIRSRYCSGPLRVWRAALPGLQATPLAWWAELPTV
jgi:hypothetical protein